MLHKEVILPSTFELLRRIQSLPEFSAMRLVGGTALAMYFGHRISIDLDLFGSWPADVDLCTALSNVGKTEKTSGNANSRMQFYYVDDVKIDCVAYDGIEWLDAPYVEDGVLLAGIRDIAAMKILAITNRGSRKDFIDLAFLLEHYNLSSVMEWYLNKFPDATPALALRSLSYFDDAELMPMPRMLSPFEWEKAKKRVQTAVRSIIN